MAGKIKVADDFGPQERDYIRTYREFEAGNDLFRNGGTAQNVTALQHQDLLSCARQIRGVDQAIVAAADDDSIVSC